MDPTKKELYGAKRSSGVDMSDPEIAAAWERVKDDSTREVLLMKFFTPFINSYQIQNSNL
jgi:hypothetical protein